MVKFGFHMNISGGLSQVPEEAHKLECSTIQIFSHNPRGWDYSPLNLSEVEIFKQKMKQYKIDPLVIHMPYLPNPASPDKEKYQKSFDALVEELKRADILNAQYVNIHIGKSMGSPLEEALQRVSQYLNEALLKVKSQALILLENTAGQGSEIGYQFEHIRDIIHQIKDKTRVGVCLDTAHLFGAGYDLKDKKAVEKTFRLFDKIVGIKFLYAIHFNDSLSKFNSHVDRHWHIGQGEMGMKSMEAILQCELIHHLPFILETPKNKPNDDKMNLKTMKKLLSRIRTKG